MTTLVTGSSGFLGGLVLRKLAEAGEPVRGFDRVEPADLPNGAEAVTGDILDPDAVAAATKGVEHVVHAAAIAALWTPGRFDYDRVNVVGTCRVLAAARRAGAKTVVVSSFTTLIAKGTPANQRLDETAEHVPNQLLGPYPRSKRQAELAALAAADAGQHISLVLPAAPIGPGDINLTPPARMLRDLASGKTPALIDCTLNLVDAEAVADGIIAARTLGRSGERYLLSGEDLSMRTVADIVAELSGQPAPRRTVPMGVALAAARVEAIVSRWTKRPPTAPLTGVRLAAHPVTLDSTKAQAELGLVSPNTTQSIQAALEWMRGSGQLPQG